MCQSWLMSCSFTRLITSYRDNGRHFIKMFFHRLITGTNIIWKPSSFGWDRNESLNLFLSFVPISCTFPYLCAFRLFITPLEEEGELFLSFDFLYNFVSFLKLQTLQGFKVICAWSSVMWVRQCKVLQTCQLDFCLANSLETKKLLEFLSLTLFGKWRYWYFHLTYSH